MSCRELIIDRRYSALADFMDPSVGIVAPAFRARIHTACPRVFLYGTRHSSVRELAPHRLRASTACSTAGIDTERRSALRACIIEGLERYAGGIIPEGELVTGTEQQIERHGYRVLGQNAFSYFLPAQLRSPAFAYDPWTRQARLRWCLCESLAGNEPAYVPAQLVYVPYTPVEGETRVFCSTSNGLACHRSLDHARYAGLCEVVERDAFLIYWHHMSARPEVRVDSLHGKDRSIDRLLALVRAVPALTLTVKDITTDVRVPAVLCVLRNRSNRDAPAAAFAAAADLDVWRALRKALNELLGTYVYAHRLQTETACGRHIELGPEHWDKVRSLEEHVVLFCGQGIHEYIRWIDAGPSIGIDDLVNDSRWHRQPWDTCAEHYLHECVARLKAAGLEVFSRDVTSPEIVPYGFQVARVVVPGCVPLHSIHASRPLGCPRLEQVPPRLGLPCASAPNEVPHPYP